MPTTTKAKTPKILTYALCRSMGHEWHHGPPIGSDEASTQGFRVPFGGSFGMIGLPSSCAQCGTQRLRWITRSGDSIVRYHHPEDYARHGDDRLSPMQWRVTYVASIFDKFDPAPVGATRGR